MYKALLNQRNQYHDFFQMNLLLWAVRPTKSTAWNRRDEEPDPSTCLPTVSCDPNRGIYLYGYGGTVCFLTCSHVVSTVSINWKK